MKTKIKARIIYKIDSEHPDISDMPEKYWKDKFFEYEDTYTFADWYTEEDAVAYVKTDLSLIAGGGYNSKHIHDVEYDIMSVRKV